MRVPRPGSPPSFVTVEGNLNTSRQFQGCQRIWGLGADALCYSRGRSSRGHWRKRLRFLPQDFHRCGKHCGKRALEL